MAVTAIPSGPDRVFHHGNREFLHRYVRDITRRNIGCGLASNGKSVLLAQRIWEDNVNAKGGLLDRSDRRSRRASQGDKVDIVAGRFRRRRSSTT
jgi:hypothetical protein